MSRAYDARYLTTLSVKFGHAGHSNTRLSWSGLSGSIQASHICEWQTGQKGRPMTFCCGRIWSFLTAPFRSVGFANGMRLRNDSRDNDLSPICTARNQAHRYSSAIAVAANAMANAIVSTQTINHMKCPQPAYRRARGSPWPDRGRRPVLLRF